MGGGEGVIAFGSWGGDQIGMVRMWCDGVQVTGGRGGRGGEEERGWAEMCGRVHVWLW